MSSPSFSTLVYQQSEDVVDSAPLLWVILCRMFGAEKKLEQSFLELRRSMQSSPVGLALCDIGVSAEAGGMVRSIQSQLPDLISGSDSIVDQHLWERASHTVTTQRTVVETDLFTLITGFVGHVTFSFLLGTEFMDAYPGVLDDCRDLDDAMKYLLIGIPSWFPIPVLTRARNARHRLNSAINSYQRALDKVTAGEEPEAPWTDLSDVSTTTRERNALYRGLKVPPGLKGPLDMRLLWWSVLLCTIECLKPKLTAAA